MNKKEEFLEKLSYEELEFIGNITRTELMRAIEAKKPKAERVDICGNYYYYKEYGILCLLQVIDGPDVDGWHNAAEISIEGNEVSEYEASHEYEDILRYKPLDPKIYKLIKSKIEERDDALKNFNNQIKEIIETLKS